MIDLDEFLNTLSLISTPDKWGAPIDRDPPSLPPPNETARHVVQRFHGYSFTPNSPDGLDVEIFPEAATGHEPEIIRLSECLNAQLSPVGAMDSHHGIILIDSNERVFVLGVDVEIVYCPGDGLLQAFECILTGGNLLPVLPRRPYVQEHNCEHFLPGASGVFWVDSNDWICDTRVDGDE